MSGQRRADTEPELRLRRELHRLGLRYRLHRKELPGTPDLVFVSARVAVFVDGCFWHGCPLHGVAPKANADWWRAKLERNRARDADVDLRLGQLGWEPVHVWEHEDMCAVAAVLRDLVRARISGS